VSDPLPTQANAVISLPSFIVSCAKDRVIIIRTEGPGKGEGGFFDIAAFDEVVSEFFNNNF
jgi:hypothetical protein